MTVDIQVQIQKEYLPKYKLYNCYNSLTRRQTEGPQSQPNAAAAKYILTNFITFSFEYQVV